MKHQALTPDGTSPGAPRAGRSPFGVLRRLTLGTAFAAALVAAPLLALFVIALQGDLSTFRHVGTTVLPTALMETALLLAGVSVVVSVIGVGAAWVVTAYDFPFRRTLAAALALPLAIPPYIVAYIYVELAEPLGPVQTAFRALTGYRSKAEYWFPTCAPCRARCSCWAWCSTPMST